MAVFAQNACVASSNSSLLSKQKITLVGSVLSMEFIGKPHETRAAVRDSSVVVKKLEIEFAVNCLLIIHSVGSTYYRTSASIKLLPPHTTSLVEILIFRWKFSKPNFEGYYF